MSIEPCFLRFGAGDRDGSPEMAHTATHAVWSATEVRPGNTARRRFPIMPLRPCKAVKLAIYRSHLSRGFAPAVDHGSGRSGAG